MLSFGLVYLLNRLKFIEQELAKKRGKNIDQANEVETELKRTEDELYKVPEHLKVSDLLNLCAVLFFYYFLVHTSIEFIMTQWCLVACNIK